MAEVGFAFGRRERIYQASAESPETIDCSFRCAADQPFHLREHEFNRVQIRTVRRQVEYGGSNRCDCFSDTGDFVRLKIVHHDEISSRQSRHELLLDVLQKQLTVDCAIDNERSRETIVPQSPDECGRLPMTMRNLGDQTCPAGAAPIATNHVRFDPGFIDEYQSSGVPKELVGLPGCAPLSNIRAILLGGFQDFFLKVRCN